MLAVAFLVAAGVYASVGHAGASAYLAVMALAGFAAEVMRPTALSLNVIVAVIATHRFYTARCFQWRTLWPFVLASVPLAFVGGMIHVPANVYRPMLGVVLVFAAARMAAPQRWFQRAKQSREPSPLPLSLGGRGGGEGSSPASDTSEVTRGGEERSAQRTLQESPSPLPLSLGGRGGSEERSAQWTLQESPSQESPSPLPLSLGGRGGREELSPLSVCVDGRGGKTAARRAAGSTSDRRPAFSTSIGVGAGLGFLSGLTGVGGGIFLSPLLLLARWAEVRETAGLSAGFILLNSIAGLMGSPGSLRNVPAMFPVWAGAVLVGGAVGATLGSRRIPPDVLKRMLAVVLLIAAGKMLFA